MSFFLTILRKNSVETPVSATCAKTSTTKAFGGDKIVKDISKENKTFPAGSFNTGKVCIVVAVIASIILMSIATTALGPILWGVAPSASALLAGKILTFISIGNIGLTLITTVLATCCASSICSSCLGSDASEKF